MRVRASCSLVVQLRLKGNLVFLMCAINYTRTTWNDVISCFDIQHECGKRTIQRTKYSISHGLYTTANNAIKAHYSSIASNMASTVPWSCAAATLASCLINAQPLPAHSPVADDNSLIGCTSHDLTDDWSLPVPIVVDNLYPFRCSFGRVFYRTRFIWQQCTVRQYHSDLSDQSALEIKVKIRVGFEVALF